MNTPHLSNYLRTFRRRTGFSQDELAFLLGCNDGAKISRYEHNSRHPTFQTALACEAVLGTSTRQLFAGDYEKVEYQTSQRAEMLAKRLRERKLDRTSQRKLESLWAITCGWGSC